uniref:Uncharacterized protein TCIL3000_10_10290 n=1 Tax=Trypanosoma congolense (strain IL3000) TaxID=1068625 RepID=G0UXY3_TRYCI|nr:unnamed protein product [Trypanosoma congolense IL3000]
MPTTHKRQNKRIYIYRKEKGVTVRNCSVALMHPLPPCIVWACHTKAVENMVNYKHKRTIRLTTGVIMSIILSTVGETQRYNGSGCNKRKKTCNSSEKSIHQPKSKTRSRKDVISLPQTPKKSRGILNSGKMVPLSRNGRQECPSINRRSRTNVNDRNHCEIFTKKNNRTRTGLISS